MILTKQAELWDRDPVRTEVEAFRSLDEIFTPPGDITYLAYPWAQWINRAALPQALQRVESTSAFTVCQHTRFREILPLLADAGVTTLFTPHASLTERVIHGVSILGFPHFPVAYKPQVIEPDILFSFIGAPTSKVRQDIVSKLGSGEFMRIRKGQWHFGNPEAQQVKELEEYGDVMSRSRFALCPKGTGPSSLRIWEAIASGAIPIIIADDLRLPLGIDWTSCSIRIAEKNVDSIPDLLSGMSEDDYRRLQAGVGKARTTIAANFAFPVLNWIEHVKYPVFMEEKECRLIERYLGPDHTCLEWGAGGSTLHFSQLVRRYVSIEHDLAWHSRLASLGAPAELILTEVDHTGGAGDPQVFAEYIRRPVELKVKFDRILIDGRCREACAMQVLESNLLAPGGLVFFHDWTRQRYHSVLSHYDVIDEIFSDHPSRNGLAVLVPKRNNRMPYGTSQCFSRDAIHPRWKDSLVFHSSGRFNRTASGCQGGWVIISQGLIELKWDNWNAECLTEEGDVLPLGPQGRPIIDLPGRLANQYIWLAYGLQYHAEALRLNPSSKYLLGDISHGMEILAASKVAPCLTHRWNNASRWQNLLHSQSQLQQLIVPPDLKEIPAIALHARLGDKVGNQGYLPFTREFATKALAMMPEELEVNVFSDSPLLARSLVEGIRPRMNFVQGKTPREDFLKICAHTHHIIPDSTFSWMASFLSPFRKKAIYHSNPRYGGRFDFPGFDILSPSEEKPC